MNILQFRERVSKLESIDRMNTIWESDALLIHVRKGLGKLRVQSVSEGEKVSYSLLLNSKPLVTLHSDNYYCPTCEKLIKRGYGLQNVDDSLIQDVKDSEQADIDIAQAFELVKPLLSLLENGLYLITKVDMCPTDGEGSYFWSSFQNERYFKATADVYYNFHHGAGWPNFLYPTQPLERLDLNRVNYYQEQIKLGMTMTGLAFYIDGFISALLDGHHRATAACLEVKKIKCLTIMKVNGYQLEKGGISQIWAGGNDLWNKFDDESKFEFEVLLKVLFSENPTATYLILKRIISDSSKREFWEMAYEYLATFNNEEVEDIFINYLLDSEPDKHDKIRKLADEYLNKR